MVKFLAKLVIFPTITLFLFGGFFAVPVSAQTADIKESCKLSSNLDIEIPFQSSSAIGTDSIVSIKEGSTISPQMKSGGIVAGGAAAKFKSAGGQGGPYAAIQDVNALRAIENKWGLICLVNSINSVAGWIFFILISISFVFILVAGFMWATSGTNSENQKKAGQMIAAALVGIVIALLSRIIPGVVMGILS
ncbi:MAG: hypothetical protein WAP23_01450 [Candidatus Spechtbacterales bacterium]